jgi:hypothetical protein
MININPNSLSKSCLVDIVKNSSIVRIANKMTKPEVKKIIEQFYDYNESKFKILNRLTREDLFYLYNKMTSKDAEYTSKDYLLNKLMTYSIGRLIDNMDKTAVNKALIFSVYDNDFMKENILESMTKQNLINLAINLYK